jgi:hypothetical protein
MFPSHFKLLLHGILGCSTYISFPAAGVLSIPHLARVGPLRFPLKQHSDDVLCSRFLLNIRVVEEDYISGLGQPLFELHIRHYYVSKSSNKSYPEIQILRPHLSLGQLPPYFGLHR